MDLNEKLQIQKIAKQLFYSETVEDSKKNLTILSDALFKIFIEHSKEKYTSQRRNEAKLMVQMLFTKVLYLNKMLDGVEFHSIYGDKVNNIIDPMTLCGVVRMVYESIAAFNLVYVLPQNEEEQIILYNLWVIAGLKYRQRFEVSNSDGKLKQQEELQKIQNLIDEIHQTKLYQTSTADIKTIIDKKIKDKEYKIYFNNGTIKSLAWQEVAPVIGIKDKFFGQMYTYFSMYSHPSNVSVFQFRDLFNKTERSFIAMSLFNVENAIKLVSLFISAYVRLFPETLKYFEQLPLIHQVEINFHSTFIMEAPVFINDALDKLE
jgi:hypothetical protein